MGGHQGVPLGIRAHRDDAVHLSRILPDSPPSLWKTGSTRQPAWSGQGQGENGRGGRLREAAAATPPIATGATGTDAEAAGGEPGILPGSPPGRRRAFRRSRRRARQLRDDVVFGRRRREERSGELAGGEVGHRDVDAVPFPSLEIVPWSRRGYFAPGLLFGGFPPGGKQQDVGAGQRHQAGGQQARQDGKPSPRYPPSSGTRTGRWRCGGRSRRRSP